MNELLALAEQALRQAYAPYSRFRVGAALRSASGALYSGCNVENAAYPLGSCAERAAISAAVLAEGPTLRILEIAVLARDEHDQPRSAAPCGACRQLIMELGREAAVLFTDSHGTSQRWTIAELLPAAFVLPGAEPVDQGTSSTQAT
jgi:cytidine deaminase